MIQPAADFPLIVPVVLSGGAGTRLWPVSREGYPKPFMKLPDGQTLLGKTVQRAERIAGANPILVVTNRDYYFDSRDVINRACGLSGQGAAGAPRSQVHYLLEPVSRNTAAAVACAALWVSQHVSPDAIMLVMPADHLISPVDSFLCAASQAAKLAAQGKLVTFGVRPTRPETGYGYIEIGDGLPGAEAHQVRRFVEKPDASTALTYVDSGRFLWNSGMFGLRAQTLLDELAHYRPELSRGVHACWGQLPADHSLSPATPYTELPAEAFGALESISIDYAVMEPSSQLAVLAANFQWDDIGSWTAVASLTPQDAHGNRTQGETVLIDTQDCYIRADDRLVATVGLQGVMVVDTPDAVLVADARRAQDVKEVVAHLKRNGHDSYRLHRTVMRPWGAYTVLEEGDGYKIKRLDIKPGGILSLQMHHHRSEHWVVVGGSATVQRENETLQILTNQSVYIPAGQKHRVENTTAEPLVMIEVQSGPYLGEDDIVRFSDVYGRAAG